MKVSEGTEWVKKEYPDKYAEMMANKAFAGILKLAENLEIDTFVSILIDALKEKTAPDGGTSKSGASEIIST